MKYTLYCLGAVDVLENVGMHIYGDDDVLGVVGIEEVEEALTRNAEDHTEYTFTVADTQITNTIKRFRSQHVLYEEYRYEPVYPILVSRSGQHPSASLYAQSN